MLKVTRHIARRRTSGSRRRSTANTLILVALTAASCGDATGPPGVPPPASALRFGSISAGYYHTCALTPGGSAFCWGLNGFGTLGDGSRTTRTLPTAVAGGHTYAQLDAGAGHNCALDRGGFAWCWGQNDEGQVGDGTYATRIEPVRVNTGLRFVAVSAGHAHSCALTAEGVAWCWGDDSAGQLGNGADATGKYSAPVRVVASKPFASVVAGYYQTCGIAVGGDAYCWGANDSGQNGDATTVSRHQPTPVTGALSFSDISPGDRFVCARSNTATYCWGANRKGELGTAGGAGSTTPLALQPSPPLTSLTTASGASTIPGAEPFACGLRADGRVLCWGGAIRSLRPATTGVTELDPAARLEHVSAGAQHVCGLSRDGYAYCGGSNYAGQLGNGTFTDRAQLLPIPGPERS